MACDEWLTSPYTRTTIVNSLQAGIVGLPNVGKVNNGRRDMHTCCMAVSTAHWFLNTCTTLPPSYQSTLFNSLVENGKAQAANYPFCTIEPNTGMVTVPDPRLQVLSKISGSKVGRTYAFKFQLCDRVSPEPFIARSVLSPPLLPLYPKELIPATVEFVDIAGLVKGASKGEGMGNQFLTNIRDTNAVCQARLTCNLTPPRNNST